MVYSYITVLSNWILGYDRYKKVYSKDLISQSTFKDVFYLLKEDELEIGLNKAKKLLLKTQNENNEIISNNKIIKINTIQNSVHKNTRNGLGWYINQNFIEVDSVEVFENEKWIKKSIEDITALSFNTKNKLLNNYNQLKPITLSFLPIANACQAKCKFCFSESSISVEQEKKIEDFFDLEKWCKEAKNKGAKRFVITGGGEPTLLGFEQINNILNISSEHFEKNVLITNGLFLKNNTEAKVKELYKSGLSVLALSCHHYDININQDIMGINTHIHNTLQKIKDIKNKPLIRLVCVLQKNGVDNQIQIQNYINFALKNNVEQICFKELYVASTEESLYTNSKENNYCEVAQVPLKEILDFSQKNNLSLVGNLPWGAPIYRYEDNNKVIDIAAYTEPSLGWERYNGIARSWNYMADNKCYSTLEDLNSEISLK